MERTTREARANAASAEARLRLARDLHDSLGKTLYGISLAAAAIPHWIARDSAVAAQKAAALALSSAAALSQLRALVAGLRTDDGPASLPEAVRTIVEAWSNETGIEASAHVDGFDAPVGGEARGELLAVLREALTNVERHAGARRVRVTLRCLPEAVELRVRDDGRGYDQWAVADRPGHFGLVGMTERARRAHGSLTIGPAAGSGTDVLLRLPLRTGSARPAHRRSSPAAGATAARVPA